MSGKIFKTTIIVLACILVAVLVAIFLFGLIKGYSPKYIYKKLVPGSVEGIYKAVDIIEHDGYENFYAASDGRYIYLLEDDAVAVYDSRNGDVSYISPEYKQAVMDGYNGRVVVHDITTGSFSVLDQGIVKASGSLGRSILGAKLTADGGIGFVMPGGDGFRGSYILLDDEYEKSAEYSYSDRYPVSGCVSPDGDFIAVAGIREKLAGTTSIDIYEKGGENPISGKNMDIIAPILIAFGRNSFAACGTDSINIYSFIEEGKTIIEPGKVRMAMGVGRNLFAVVSSTGTDIVIKIDENGSIEWKKNIPAGIQGMEISDDHIFYWNSTECGVLDMKGTSLVIQGDPGVLKSILVLDEYMIAIVTDSRIILYEFN